MTTRVASQMTCAGCGYEPPAAPDPAAGTGYPFRCARARDGDDVDHVLTRTLDPTCMIFPREQDANPFVTYRTLLHSWQLARAFGMADGDYITAIRSFDADVARVDGHGFHVTPFGRDSALSDRLGFESGGVWMKDETGDVSGSHKARHLAGIMIYLHVLDALGLSGSASPRLAIASCGNAALAAAVVARAGRRALDVFIPPDAPPAIVARLSELGAQTVICSRAAGTQGDPCYLQFRDAVTHAALPFCCQGPANGLTIEGGETLGWEMVAELGSITLDAVVIQVGGGALASAIIQSFVEATQLGACTRLPRFYTVQTTGAFPLRRAYERLADRICRSFDIQPSAADPAGAIAAHFDSAPVQSALRYAATHRSSFMWSWETEPHSIARGILDDETYDWLAVMEGMLRTGGNPIVVGEETLEAAYRLAREATDINVDHTGAAGLAGVLQLVDEGVLTARDSVAVVFSGRERAMR